MSFANVSWLQETKNGTLCFVSVERDDYTLNVCSARLCCRGKRNEASWFPINYRLKKNNSYLQIFWSIFHLISRMPSPVNQAQIRKTLQGCVSRWQWQHSSINHHRNTQIIIDDAMIIVWWRRLQLRLINPTIPCSEALTFTALSLPVYWLYCVMVLMKSCLPLLMAFYAFNGWCAPEPCSAFGPNGPAPIN